jgi:integrase
MPRKRSKENQGLPARWRHTHGAYYYQVPPGLEHLWEGKKTFRLGDKLNEAYKVWADRLQKPTQARTVGELLDRYALEVIPAKAAASQQSNHIQMLVLRRVFGNQPLLPFAPQLVYQYVDRRSVKKKDPKTGKVTGGRIAAHREIELLSHAYTKAVEWGYIDRHPFKNEVRLKGEAPRDRYVEDWEIVEALSLDSRRKKGSVLMIQAYLRLKLLTGMAQGDLLRLQESQLKEDGIHNQRHKTAASTGKKTIYQWTPELRAAITLAKQSRPVHISPFLFCNRQGQGYVDEETGTAAGWKSMWQRFMARVIEETKVKEHFTEHDLRAKVASDAGSLEHARSLLAHADSRTTDRIYRRKAEVVKPLR